MSRKPDESSAKTAEITGRNKVRVFKSYKRSVKRVELYDSLRIFEPEI